MFWRIQGILSGLVIISIVTAIGIVFSVPIPYIVVAIILVLVAASFDAIVVSNWRYRFYRYSLDGTGLRLYTGRMLTRRTHVPARQILYMRTKQGPLLRRSGVVHLQVGTLGEVFSVLYLPAERAQQHVSDYEQQDAESP